MRTTRRSTTAPGRGRYRLPAAASYQARPTTGAMGPAPGPGTCRRLCGPFPPPAGSAPRCCIWRETAQGTSTGRRLCDPSANAPPDGSANDIWRKSHPPGQSLEPTFSGRPCGRPRSRVRSSFCVPAAPSLRPLWSGGRKVRLGGSRSRGVVLEGPPLAQPSRSQRFFRG